MGRVRFQRAFEFVHRFALLGMNYGVTADLKRSGEIRVIDYLSQNTRETRVIFDVGANVGAYAREVLARAGNKAVIHCFEPSERAFVTLNQGLGRRDNVYLYRLGLGRENEIATLYSDSPGSELGSVFRRQLDHANIKMNHEEKVQLRRLDDFCAELGIRHIDLVKLDVECNELNVLAGASGMIEAEAIDLIQFEFGGLDSRTYLQDYFELLSPTYRIYRIVRDGLVPLNSYDERLEIFVATNYLAVSRKITLPTRLDPGRPRLNRGPYVETEKS